MVSKVREYRLELLAVVLAVSGGALVLARGRFDQWLAERPAALMELWRYINQEASRDLRSMLDSIGLTTIAGLVLVLAVLVFAAWRIRYRFTNSENWSIERCPRCGSAVHRVHRTRFDRLLSATLLPHARRYGCVSQQCGWRGLRRHHVHHTQAHPAASSE